MFGWKAISVCWPCRTKSVVASDSSRALESADRSDARSHAMRAASVFLSLAIMIIFSLSYTVAD